MIKKYIKKIKWLLVRRKYTCAQAVTIYWDDKYRDLPRHSRGAIEVSITPCAKLNLLVGFVLNTGNGREKIVFCVKSENCKTKTFELKNINLIENYNAFQVREFCRG